MVYKVFNIENDANLYFFTSEVIVLSIQVIHLEEKKCNKSQYLFRDEVKSYSSRIVPKNSRAEKMN